MNYTYRTRGTCASQISFDLDGDVVSNVKFMGGCNGNLQAVSRLVEGLTVAEVAARCEGIRCGFKSTSCADQLVKALNEALEQAQDTAE
ncbi:MAG: TIGR03905 family TSCPD domain-containing protein [Clostridia bacterium]|nr:TIGR03905 family TSCPD domain-containing protein [Clostridia bacterium]